MEVDILYFTLLSDISSQNEVSDNRWARASWPNAKGNPQSRIGELRRVLKYMESHKADQATASHAVGRRCTFPKIQALHKGLVCLLGAETVDSELRKQVEKEPDPLKRLFLLSMAVPEEKLEEAVQAIKKVVNGKH